jgi:hypothetical protein
LFTDNYITLPWPHLYEYAESMLVIAQERWILNDRDLLPLRFHNPDAVALGELSEMIRRAACAPIEASRFHRRLVAVARFPLFARRLIWAVCLNIPRVRREIGTCAVSSAARWQTEC